MRCGTLMLVATALALVGCKDSTTPASPSLVLFSQVSAGPTHACAVSVEGRVYCWGAGELGELGNTPARSSDSPVQVPGALVFAKVAAGYNHTCALTVTGDAYCWGWGILGELGNGSFGTSPLVKVTGDHHFATLSSSWDHTCGVAEGSTIYCWGSNSDGQLGDGTFVNRANPVKVASGLRFASVSAGGRHSCALTATGSAYCWGANDLGQLGTANTVLGATPQPVASSLVFTAVSAGRTHSCALSGGQIYCWGSNVYGELGNRALQRPGIPGSPAPAAVAQDAVGSPQMLSVSSGSDFTCAVSATAGYCWGAGTEGQLGTGARLNTTVPLSIAGVSGSSGSDPLNLVAVSAAGLTYACGLTTQNSVFCWGNGEHGELGLPGVTQSVLPVRVQGGH